MKNAVKAATCLVFSFLSVTATAQDDTQWYNGIYVGGSYGQAKINSGANLYIDREGGYVIDPQSDLTIPFRAGVLAGPVNYYSSTQQPVTFDFFTGYQFMGVVGGHHAGVELRMALTAPQSVFGIADVSSSAVGLFGTIQTSSDVYVKGLLGMASSTFDVAGATSALDLNASSTGLAYGLAIGQKIFGGAIEFTFIKYPEVRLETTDRTVDFNMSLSLDEVQNVPSTLKWADKIGFQTLTLGYTYTF